MPSENCDFRTRVRIFIEKNSDILNLNVYHVSLLKVIADYCDMPLGYCCLSFKHLQKYSRMSERQRRNITIELINLKLIEQSFLKGKPIHRLGEIFSENT